MCVRFYQKSVGVVVVFVLLSSPNDGIELVHEVGICVVMLVFVCSRMCGFVCRSCVYVSFVLQKEKHQITVRFNGSPLEKTVRLGAIR
jgi:hypothetical protein